MLDELMVSPTDSGVRGSEEWYARLQGELRNREILAAQKPQCLCVCNSLILGDRDSPI
jgi:hypothetical protein